MFSNASKKLGLVLRFVPLDFLINRNCILSTELYRPYFENNYQFQNLLPQEIKQY